MSKASSWAMSIGFLLLLLGLCFVPAAFKEHSDPTILGAGVCLVAFGALSAAAGFYLKAQAIQAGMTAPEAAKTPAKRVRGGCDLCGTEVPVIHCRVHDLHLCGECLASHYEFRACAYVPSTRRALVPKPPTRPAAKPAARFAAKV